MGLLSGLFGSQSASRQRKLEQKRINNQFAYDTSRWQFDNQLSKQTFKYNKQSLKIQKQNDKALREYQYQTELMSARFQQSMMDYQYRSQMQQYQKSEEIFKQQVGFNQMAANRAFESEGRRMRDVISEQAYQKQELFTSLLQKEGSQMARGVSGKSAQKGMQSTLAEFGRNQAILADSMLSGKDQYRSNLKDIRLQWYGANLAADSNRMLKPQQLPRFPMPMKQPKPMYQDPMRPMTPPAPIKGTNVQPGGNLGAVIGSSALSAGAAVGGAALTAAAAGTPFGWGAAGVAALGSLF